MIREPRVARFCCLIGVLVLARLTPVVAQDVRGLEICTAEKQIERRTGCLQFNVEFLQQALAKLARETQDKIAKADQEVASAQAEIAELKSTVGKLNAELEQMKAKPEPSGKK
jgi:septal ring factor EnvC (AmiA/AmiB activator)